MRTPTSGMGRAETQRWLSAQTGMVPQVALTVRQGMGGKGGTQERSQAHSSTRAPLDFRQ